MDGSPSAVKDMPTRRHVLDICGQRMELIAPDQPDALLDDPLVEQRYRLDNYMPYWPVVWPAGLMLAQSILDGTGSPPIPPPQGGAVLELGCGLGAAGIAAGGRGWHVTFTDYDAWAIAFAKRNALLNGIPAERIDTVEMDWRKPLAKKFPWIIASDVLYERRLHPWLLEALEQLLAGDGCAWISDPLRNSAQDFPLAAVAAGFACTEMPLERCEQGLMQKGTLYVLRHAKQKF